MIVVLRHPEAFIAQGLAVLREGYGIADRLLVGTPREVADKVLRWVAAGIDAIAVFLPHDSEPETLRLMAEEVVPLVAQSHEWRG